MTIRPAAALEAIASAFALGTVRAAEYLPHGILNRNWRIDTDRGRHALKELDALEPDLARRRLELLPRLAAAGVPVAEAVPSADGDLVPRIGARAYYLSPWIDGDHPRGEAMTPEASRHMGAVIGRIHTALADPATGLDAPKAPELAVMPLGEAVAAVAMHLRRIEDRTSPDDFDRAAAAGLRRRLDLLAAHGHRRPETAGTGPHGWTHGDCQNWNLLWRGGRIVAVLDWDRLRPNAYGEEIARAAMYQCVRADGSVDLANVAALIAGYRTESAIGTEALAEAARHRWWRIAASVWHLEYRYDKGVKAAEALFHSDERLLHWWTANLDEVEAAFM
ncbi:phosphotransferase [Glycomyces paridis]|uniref:Aminoglycoside phosphotransferase domain-containing protein n=1 Tax=Glycomyces paridis TaxID=2126555 RepID=A0A4S8P938_9ACTN|nr:phosphotransferase [Glycomyces paridis]THV26753.1 hypothetical protein E9998_17350 [Glycomyces paridis]